jgi:hypothetical protein
MRRDDPPRVPRKQTASTGNNTPRARLSVVLGPTHSVSEEFTRRSKQARRTTTPSSSLGAFPQLQPLTLNVRQGSRSHRLAWLELTGDAIDSRYVSMLRIVRRCQPRLIFQPFLSRRLDHAGQIPFAPPGNDSSSSPKTHCRSRLLNRSLTCPRAPTDSARTNSTDSKLFEQVEPISDMRWEPTFLYSPDPRIPRRAQRGISSAARPASRACREPTPPHTARM